MNRGRRRPPIDVREFEDYVRRAEVRRAEARFAAGAHLRIAQPFAPDRELRPRFERDRGADSRAAAPMGIRCRAGPRDPHEPPGWRALKAGV